MRGLLDALFQFQIIERLLAQNEIKERIIEKQWKIT